MIPNMSSVSEAEQERQKWMTLKDALSHIQHVDQCDEKSALYSLRNALSDAAVAYQLEDKGRFFVPNFFRGGRNRALELYFWSFISIDQESGGTIDANAYECFFYGEDLQNWYDPDVEGMQFADLTASSNLNIFVSTDDVLKIWTTPISVSAEESRPISAEKNGLASRPVTERKRASTPEIRETAVRIYDEAEKAGAKPPNITEAFHLIAKRLAPRLAPKRKVFPVLSEKQFEDRRWGPGQRSPKK
jgi:hypothetical protein